MATADAKLTWTSLVKTIEAANTEVTKANARVETVTNCGKGGQAYASLPTTDGACADVKSASGASLNALGAKVLRLDTALNSLILCNQQNKAFDGITCKSLPALGSTKVTQEAIIKGGWRSFMLSDDGGAQSSGTP